MCELKILDSYKKRIEKVQSAKKEGEKGILGLSYLEQAAILTHYLKLKGKADYRRPYEIMGSIIQDNWVTVLRGDSGRENVTIFVSLAPHMWVPSSMRSTMSLSLQPRSRDSHSLICFQA